jgi:hypothetical protein
LDSKYLLRGVLCRFETNTPEKVQIQTDINSQLNVKKYCSEIKDGKAKIALNQGLG